MGFVEDYLSGSSRFLRESSLAVFISAVMSLGAGLLLGMNSQLFLLMPGLVVLIPASIGMRGNIFGSMGSRFGSALHLGSLQTFEWKNEVVKNNVYASFTLTIIFSVFLGIIAELMLMAFHLPSIGISSLVLISFMSGFISGIILIFITFSISFLSYRQGWDPDNVTSPLITGMGDLVTIPIIILSAYFVISMKSHLFIMDLLLLVLLVATGLLMSLSFMRTKGEKFISKISSYKSIVFQSSLILLVTTVLDSIAGILIQSNIETLISAPVLLAFIPVLLEEGGNIGNILGSRLSTRLHLGSIKPLLSFEKPIKREFINLFILVFITFPMIGIVTFYLGQIVGLGGISVVMMAVIALISGLMLVAVVSFFSYIISILSYRHGFDPDNTTIPLVTTLADVLGMFALVAAMAVLGII